LAESPVNDDTVDWLQRTALGIWWYKIGPNEEASNILNLKSKILLYLGLVYFTPLLLVMMSRALS